MEVGNSQIRRQKVDHDEAEPNVCSSPRLEILTEQSLVELLGFVVATAGDIELVAECIECRHAAGLARLEPCIEDEIWELAFFFDIADDGADLADHQLKHRDLLLEQSQHLLLKGAARNEIEYEHLARLTDTVDAADPLLDCHRVPWHVEVD